MSKAADVYTLITGLDLTAHGVTPSAITRSASAVNPEHRPFVIVKWGAETQAFGMVAEAELSIWVYDEPSSYVRIDAILADIVAALRADTSLGDVRWNGTSADLYDDVFMCVTRYASLTLPLSH